jgi:hypothetical protein
MRKLNRNSILKVGAVLVGLIIILSNLQLSDSILTYKMLVTVQPEKNPIMEGEFPVIVGTVKDEAYKPVVNANILILYGNEAVTTTTDKHGNYRYKSAIPAMPGTYEIDVTATKDGYIKGLASSMYHVDSFLANRTANVSTTPLKTINGLPVRTGNYTVYLGKVGQWNLETTCFVAFADKYVRFLKTCDLYNLEPAGTFQPDQKMIPMISVVQHDGTYRLFSQNVYDKAYYMNNDTLKTFIPATWANYTAPN